MNFPAMIQPAPLTQVDDEIRVTGTRVPLSTVVTAFEQGSTPEEIAQDYSSLQLSQVYAVITYYLQNREEVCEYMAQRAADSERIRKEIESRPDYQDLRRRLLARMEAARADQV
jgi:uncharacterized protein (DUF433 family)